MLVRDAPGPPAGIDASGIDASGIEASGIEASGIEASGIEVFMLRRNLSSAFVAGAYVFPGGAVDAHDGSDEMRALVSGLDDESASELLGRADGGLDFWVAAIRESFEEAGVLLARDAARGVHVSSEIVERLDAARASVVTGDLSFADLVRDAGLVLDGGCLRVFGRWITPSPAPRRYDTWFFLAPAPDGHTYVHDEVETIASTWIRPADALRRARRAEIELILPTYRCLEALSRFDSAAALFAAVDDAWQQPADALQPVEATRAWQIRLPGDDDHADTRTADARAHSTTSRRPAATGAPGRGGR
jgi:8-oxo-dGTP pyrophosphatase MutT (NUDIX family)